MEVSLILVAARLDSAVRAQALADCGILSADALRAPGTPEWVGVRESHSFGACRCNERVRATEFCPTIARHPACIRHWRERSTSSNWRHVALHFVLLPTRDPWYYRRVVAAPAPLTERARPRAVPLARASQVLLPPAPPPPLTLHRRERVTA